MITYHFQISIPGTRTPWAMIKHRSRRFREKKQAEKLAIRAAGIYKAEVRLSTGKHPLESNAQYFRSPLIY